jgi:DNA-binding transcriptional LysR family regulator
MNLHFLRSFFAVASRGSFSQAARDLYISQSAVSRAVQDLEREIGSALLHRSAHDLSLTEAGQILYDHATLIFAMERDAYAALEQLQGLKRGHLTIGASNTIGTYLLPPLLGDFHRRYPDIRLNLEISNTTQIIGQLRTAPFDVAFVEGQIDTTGLVVTPWRVDHLIVIAPADHALVRKETVSLDELLAEPFILREPQSATRAAIESVLQTHGVHLKIAMELGSNQAVKQAVSAGLGLAIVSEATVELEITCGKLVILNVSELNLTRTLSQVVVVSRSPSPALKAFLAMVAEN